MSGDLQIFFATETFFATELTSRLRHFVQAGPFAIFRAHSHLLITRNFSMATAQSMPKIDIDTRVAFSRAHILVHKCHMVKGLAINAICYRQSIIPSQGIIHITRA